ncbi:MAG: MBL fold metallo-hydrolase [Ectothiorhodospiraceae bacterium]|nr:MBL fold metallo-hydrolase [Ectothiorhodospiraceae bacterium]MCH8505596.1 MBL fold metallo-hydrolase [Ectothiorhodospiraceae bacterium]
MTQQTDLQYPIQSPGEDIAPVPVAKGVHWLRMPLPFSLDHINLWLLEDGDNCVLVDSGMGMQVVQERWQELERSWLANRPLGRIVITHFHPDHAGLANWLAERHQVPVSMTAGEHAQAWRVWEQSGEDFRQTVVPHFHRHGLDAERLEALGQRGNSYRRVVPSLPREIDILADGDEIEIGGVCWRVMVGRGHAPEHACLYAESLGVLISGDQLLPSITSNISCTPTDPDGDPLGHYLDSLQRLRTLPPDTLVLPSHGRVFTGHEARVDQVLAHHEERLDRLRRQCRSPSAAADTLDILFDRELDTHSLFFAMGEAIAHLNHLWHQGELVREQAADGVYRFAMR